ncbi:MAG: CidA/LrgA family protein [Parvibaculum sp.]|nr:CidA/LrgA family protein [Parvibaculum sp.]
MAGGRPSARRIGSWVLGFVVLVLCLELGNLVAWGAGLPVPGTVIGILILLAGLFALRRVPDAVNDVSLYLLGHLNLLYVPAGVGVMGYLALVARDFWPIVVTLFVSTFLATIAAALTFRWAAGKRS